VSEQGFFDSNTAQPCLGCGNLLDDATQVFSEEDGRPDAGSVSICFYCGHVSVYIGVGLRRRELTDDDSSWYDSPEFQAQLQKFKYTKRRIEAKPELN
jgi:hypothetical protein